MISVMREQLCVHYKTSHCGGGNLTFTSQFQRLELVFELVVFYYSVIGISFMIFFLLSFGHTRTIPQIRILTKEHL